MKRGNVANILMASLGVCLTLVGALHLFVATIGDFSMGRTAVTAMGVGYIVVAVPCFAFLHSRKLAKRIVVLVLVVLAATLLWLSFRPGFHAADPTIYQVAAIALAVLLLARIGLALRGKRSRPHA